MKSKLGYILIIIGLFFYMDSKLNLSRKTYIENNKIKYTLAREISYIEGSNDTYDFILSIPKLNLKKGVYKSDVVIEDNNFIFNIDLNLRKLNTDSLINLYYNHIKYTYKLDTIYNLVNDKISIYKDLNKNSITLISNKTVYIGYLIDKIKY